MGSHHVEFHVASRPADNVRQHWLTPQYDEDISLIVMIIERLQGVWPKIIPVAMEMPIFYVNFSSLNYPNLKDESLGP